jgi:hypothetical protein
MINNQRITPLRAMGSWPLGGRDLARDEEKVVQWLLAQLGESLFGERLHAFEVQKIQW